MNPRYTRVAQSAAHRCEYCRAPEAVFNRAFHVKADTGSINGVTAVGRATVSRLRMNSPSQLTARRHWMRLRLFPQT